MTREEKTAVIEALKDKFDSTPVFYLTDSSSMTVGQINELRALCFKKNIEMKVLKNTLIRKALEEKADEMGYKPLFDSLHGPTAVLFAEVGNAPAKLLKEFRKGDKTKPVLKAAYIDSSVFTGDNQLDYLTKIKSREELIGEVIGLLQSPAKTVVSALTSSGGGKIHGLLQAIGEKGA